MRLTTRACLLAATATFAITTSAQTPPGVSAMIEAAMFGKHRSAENQSRNQYRHPVGTLTAFQLQGDMTVMEIWPGGGWYTEVLAPVLRDKGKLIVASYDPEIPDQPEYRYRLHNQLQAKFASDPAVYDRVEMVNYSSPETQALGKDSAVDLLLTFRNMHGWIGSGQAENVLADFHAAIKTGGHLGIVQHRSAAGTPIEEAVGNGYVPEKALIAMVEAAGFKLVSQSEVNANPADTKNHPEGVWTLPPSLQLGENDQEKYMAIGESDRMTLLFQKR